MGQTYVKFGNLSHLVLLYPVNGSIIVSSKARVSSPIGLARETKEINSNEGKRIQ